MTYSREQLTNLEHSDNRQQIVNDLYNRFKRGEAMTLAEEEVTCSFLNVTRDNTGRFIYDVSELEACKNYYFRRTYLLYAYDLDGKGEIASFYGPIPAGQKKQDVAYLNTQFAEWQAKLAGEIGDDTILPHLIEETTYQFERLERFAAMQRLSSAEKAYFKKSIVLQSKYVYLIAKEYFQEVGHFQEEITVHGSRIVIDPFFYIHTLFRHFAPLVKPYETGKTYHMDETIVFKSLPIFLKKILSITGRNCCSKEFNRDFIAFIYHGSRYITWLKPVPKDSPEYLRAQTFYPVKMKRDRRRLQKLRSVKINRRLTLLVEYIVPRKRHASYKRLL